MNAITRALSIRQPHLHAILEGAKTIEWRRRPTNIRERIYLYASLGRYTVDQESNLIEYYDLDDLHDMIDMNHLPRGVIVGAVDLCDCRYNKKEALYEWHLKSPELFSKHLKPKNKPQPVFFKPF